MYLTPQLFLCHRIKELVALMPRWSGVDVQTGQWKGGGGGGGGGGALDNKGEWMTFRTWPLLRARVGRVHIS